METTLRGIGVSPGIAIGPALPFDVQTLDIPRYAIENPQSEKDRFAAAVEAARAARLQCAFAAAICLAVWRA